MLVIPTISPDQISNEDKELTPTSAFANKLVLQPKSLTADQTLLVKLEKACIYIHTTGSFVAFFQSQVFLPKNQYIIVLKWILN